MAIWLSPHFSLEELTVTQQRKLRNTPSSEVVERLRRTAAKMEQVRRLLGDKVVIISSGYRSPEVNRAVGGAETSAHMNGDAADFVCHGFGPPREICRAISMSDLMFDQLIEEGSWVHLSFDPRNRRQILTKRGREYVQGIAA